jgi:peptidoglycan/LPS O-acetylase OafA/YrhL
MAGVDTGLGVEERHDAPTIAAPRETRPSTHRRADIQGLRAIAVLLVVAFHAGLPVSGGFIGVDVFFVISGFVITAMLLRELDSSGKLSFGAFYTRRVRRILPAAALIIVFVSLVSLLAISPVVQHTTARTGMSAAVFVANITLYRAPNGYFDPSVTLNPFLHMWTLSVEEQFYLFFPAILLGAFVIARKLLPRSRPQVFLGVVATAVGLLSFIVCVFATNHTLALPHMTLNAQFAFYMLPARAWEFAAGALLAIAVPQLARVPRALAVVLGLAGLALIAYAAFTFDGTTVFPGTAALIPVLGTSLAIAAGTATTGGVSSLLGTSPMTRLGDLSYSWYLWHWPLIVFAVALWPSVSTEAAFAAGALSLIPAWLAFHYMENPIRFNMRIRGRRALGVAAVCVTVPIVACLVLLSAPKPSASAATRAFLTASKSQHADRTHRCNIGKPVLSEKPRCTWAVPNAKGSVVLLGDSNAGHFTEPASRAANQLGYDFTVGTAPDCPFIDTRITNNSRKMNQCRIFVMKSLKQLEAAPPKLVILASSTPIYFLSAGVTFRDSVTGQVASTGDEKAAEFSRGLQRVLQRFAAAHIPVMVIHTVPQWRNWDTANCATLRVYASPQSCGASQSRADANRFRARGLAAEDRAIRAVPGTHSIDFTQELCSASTCATNLGNDWIYRDGRHLSVKGALSLTNQFVTFIHADAKR